MRLVRDLISVTVAACFVGQAAAARDLLVVEAQDTALFAPGDIVPLDRQIQLERDAYIVGFVADGRKLAIRGSFAGIIDSVLGPESGATDTEILYRVADLFKAQTNANFLTAATRTGSRGAGPSDLYAIDVEMGGEHCLSDVKRATLWRADDGPFGISTITDVLAGATVTVEWPAETSSVDWPKTLPVRDGAQYLIAPPGRYSETRISVHVVPPAMHDSVSVAMWMAEHDCLVQATRLLLEAELDAEFGDSEN